MNDFSILDEIAVDFNPYDVLGIEIKSQDDTELDMEINNAFSEKIKGFKNQLHYAEKEKIQTAYELIKNAKRRLRYKLLSPKPLGDLKELKNNLPSKPKYVGPRKWINVITEHQANKLHRENPY